MNAAAKPNVDPERSRAILYLILTAILWSTSGILIKMVHWHPVAIAGMRSAIAALFLVAVIRRPHFTWSFSQIGGAVAYAATVIIFVSANKLTTAANAILLQYTAPVFVALFSAWFLGERIGWLDWATVLVVMGGMALFFFDRLTAGGLWGNILAVVSGVGLASLVLFLRKQKDGSPLESILLGNVLAALAGLPFMFGPPPDATGWIGLLLLGIFQLGLTYALYAIAIKHVTALEGILIPVIEPLLNPCWVFLFLGERPGSWALAGGAVVLATVTVRCVIATMSEEVRTKNAGQSA